MTVSMEAEDLLRRLAPRVLGVLVRRNGDFDSSEDAVQEALLSAAVQWPGTGIPDHPASWLITVACRCLADIQRSEAARRQREARAAAQAVPDGLAVPGPDDDGTEEDDTLKLLFLCCHPALPPSSQMALTLRAVGGLTTPQIARAFLVPGTTMGQRISRAKQRVRAAGGRFCMPPEPERPERLWVVLHVLYLIFNEGYTASEGPQLQRTELTGEAIRLTRELRRLLPEDGEVAGLLALMLLTEARRPARTDPEGLLVPLAEQDRDLWDQDLIEEGSSLITLTLAETPIGPYQLQAAIAAVHDEAKRPEDTDWPQVLMLYRLLGKLWPNPIVWLNHAVAVAMVSGPRAGLDLLSSVESQKGMADHHRLHAVRAHLLEISGERAAAAAAYGRAARRTTSIPERCYLESRLARLTRPR